MPMTKRGILKVISSVFDPLGFVTPFVLKGKIIIQELWRRKYEWDDIVAEDIQSVWNSWMTNAEELSNVKIDRCYEGIDRKEVDRVELHLFCDASILAFGSVAYLRFCYKDGTFKNSFVMAKSNLAPIKTMTLPRLELSAAVSAVRLYRSIIRDIELKIGGVYFWTDSTLNIQYISNDEFRFKTFVANRIAEIHESTDKNQWRHIPGDMNPADLVTRACGSQSKAFAERK